MRVIKLLSLRLKDLTGRALIHQCLCTFASITLKLTEYEVHSDCKIVFSVLIVCTLAEKYESIVRGRLAVKEGENNDKAMVGIGRFSEKAKVR